MNIRPSRGCLCLANPASPILGPFRKSLFLATGMFVPAPDRCGLGPTEEPPSYAHQQASP